MKAQRISLWCPSFTDTHGGIQQFSRLMAEGLKDVAAVHSLSIIALGATGPGVVQRSWFFIHAVIDSFVRRPHRVIITHLHLARLSPLLRLLHIPYWICAHGIECWSPQDARDRTSLLHASRILCVSRFTEHALIRALPELRGATRIFPNHVDMPDTFPDRIEARNMLGLPVDARIILTISRLSAAERYKGHREMFRALQALFLEVPSLLYVIAGDGDDRAALEALTAHLHIASRVVFLGRLNASQLEAAYAAADAFAMPSTGEGFGIVFLEAMVRGLPVLAGNEDGSVDPLQDGRFGLLVHPREPSSLLAGLRELIHRPRDSHQLPLAVLSEFGAGRIPGRLQTLMEES
jgi:glycosyltransferase involved in cell wall biosynthesis